jgi:hypothetical protein
MYYAQLHRHGKGVYADHQDEDIDVDFVYWAGFNDDTPYCAFEVPLVN